MGKRCCIEGNWGWNIIPNCCCIARNWFCMGGYCAGVYGWCGATWGSMMKDGTEGEVDCTGASVDVACVGCTASAAVWMAEGVTVTVMAGNADDAVAGIVPVAASVPITGTTGVCCRISSTTAETAEVEMAVIATGNRTVLGTGVKSELSGCCESTSIASGKCCRTVGGEMAAALCEVCCRAGVEVEVRGCRLKAVSRTEVAVAVAVTVAVSAMFSGWACKRRGVRVGRDPGCNCTGLVAGGGLTTDVVLPGGGMTLDPERSSACMNNVEDPVRISMQCVYRNGMSHVPCPMNDTLHFQNNTLLSRVKSCDVNCPSLRFGSHS